MNSKYTQYFSDLFLIVTTSVSFKNMENLERA